MTAWCGWKAPQTKSSPTRTSAAFTWAKGLASKRLSDMAATQRLELRQRQSLVMTPQLQQAIKLLQLSNLELAAEIDRELEQNPLLDREEGANDTLLEGPSVDQQGTGADSAAEGDAGDSPDDLETGLAGSGLDIADRDVLERTTARPEARR